MDDNQPPLNTKDKVKPLNNENVIESFPNIEGMDECSRLTFTNKRQDKI